MNSTDYQKMIDICATSEAFYYVDQHFGDNTFRMFNYRLASYNDWLIDPVTFEMRGLMVEIDSDEKFIRVASRPPAKFFNLNENPFVTNLDTKCSGKVADKLDGSLISTFIYTDGGITKLGLKTKMSLSSSQAVEAMNLVNKSPEFYQELFDLAISGHTVYCEYCSPTNRIVIGYDKPTLTVLGVRDSAGKELNKCDLPQLADYWVEEKIVDNVDQFIQRVSQLTQVEGFVITLLSGKNQGVRVKVKCDWYISLHHVKDSVMNPRHLFESVLDEGIDDLRSMFATDSAVIAMIDDMQDRVTKLHNHMVNVVESFYQQHKDLSRKDYAIEGQRTVDPLWFGLVMSRYLGQPIDYKEFLKSKWKVLGIKDQSNDVE